MSVPDKDDKQGLALHVAKLLLDTKLDNKREHLARVLGLMETVSVMIWASLIEDGTLEEHQKLPMFTELHEMMGIRVQEGMLSYLALPAATRPKL